MGNVKSIIEKIKAKKEEETKNPTPIPEKPIAPEEAKEELETPTPIPEKPNVPEEDEEYYEEDEDEIEEEETLEDPKEEVKTDPQQSQLTQDQELALLRDDGIYRQAMLLEFKQLNKSFLVLNNLIQEAIGEKDGK